MCVQLYLLKLTSILMRYSEMIEYHYHKQTLIVTYED